MPTPHLDKLKELLENEKLPEADKEAVQDTIERYGQWAQDMDELESKGNERVDDLVGLLNEYKRYVELDLIWDSTENFLYRQRGQIKLDNSIIEEFLPRLVDPAIIPELEEMTWETGPRTSFAAAFFATSLANPAVGAGLQIRTKAQDFTVGQSVYLRASTDPSFPDANSVVEEIYISFVAAECKTNLDKTMFQEITATAHDLKVAVPGAKFYVLVEWLDMTPLSTTATDIDEVIILRGKRLASNRRARFADVNERVRKRVWYEQFLREHPFRQDMMVRFVDHLRSLFTAVDPAEDDVVEAGYF